MCIRDRIEQSLNIKFLVLVFSFRRQVKSAFFKLLFQMVLIAQVLQVFLQKTSSATVSITVAGDVKIFKIHVYN